MNTQQTRPFGNRSTNITCGCGNNLTKLPTGVRLVPAEELRMTMVVKVTCSGCGKKINLRVAND